MTTFDIITSSLFDIDLESTRCCFNCQEFLDAEECAMRTSVKLIYNPFARWMIWNSDVRNGLKGEKKLQDIGRTIIDLYREKERGSSSDAAINQNKEKTIMSHIMSHDYPSEEHRISDLIVFLIAGHETTAHTISFFLFHLAQNPRVKRKLQHELDNVVPTGLNIEDGGKVTRKLLSLNDISSLEYFSNCQKESQRLKNITILHSNSIFLHDRVVSCLDYIQWPP